MKKTSSMALFITRYTDRTPHKEYVRNMNQPLWNPKSCDADTCIAYHGEAPLDYYAHNALKDGNFSEWDMRELPGMNQRYELPKKVIYIIERSIEMGYKYAAVMDDDASSDDPVRLVSDSIIALSRYNAGAAAPVFGYQFFTRFSSDESKAYMAPLNRQSWTGYGYQSWNLGVLKPNMSFISEMYGQLRWRSDYQIYMLVDSLGHTPVQFHNKFRHPGSSNKLAVDEASWIAQCKMHFYDHAVSRHYLSKLKNGEHYARESDRIEGVVYKLRYKETLAKAEKRGLDVSTWAVPCVEDMQAAKNAIEADKLWKPS